MPPRVSPLFSSIPAPALEVHKHISNYPQENPIRMCQRQLKCSKWKRLPSSSLPVLTFPFPVTDTVAYPVSQVRKPPFPPCPSWMTQVPYALTPKQVLSLPVALHSHCHYPFQGPIIFLLAEPLPGLSASNLAFFRPVSAQ